MTAPDISWTIDGQTLTVADWSCNSIANGGFDQMRGTVTEAQWRRLPVTPKQGSVVRADLPNGRAMWEGRLSAPPDISEGHAEIVAQGEKVVLERQTARRFYMSRDYSLWQGLADEPFTYTTMVEAIEANVKNSNLAFRYTGDGVITYAVGDDNGVGMVLEDCLITRVKFQFYRAVSNANYDIRVGKFTGPSGARTGIHDTPLSTANNTLRDTGVIASPTDGISIYLRVNTAVTPGRDNVVRLTGLRVYGLADADTYTTREVLLNLAADAAVNFNSDGVSTGLALAAMPLDWEGPWSDLADYICMLEDATWRVLERGSDGKPRMEAYKWANATNWKVRRSTGAQLDLSPLELFNKVTVSYPSPNGSTRQVSRSASPDPLSGTGITNTHFEELEDVQKDNTLAASVATNLVGRLSTSRFEGNIEVTSAKDDSGRDAAWELKGGDTVTVEDWGPGENITLRVMEVEYTPEGVTLGIEQDVSSDRLLALASLREQQTRRKKKRRG